MVPKTLEFQAFREKSMAVLALRLTSASTAITVGLDGARCAGATGAKTMAKATGRGWTEDKGAPFVVLYCITKEYGGPEEGGWFYNRWQRMEHRADVAIHRVDDVIGKLERSARDEVPRRPDGRPYEYSSVLGGVRYQAMIETTLGEHETKHRPHYE